MVWKSGLRVYPRPIPRTGGPIPRTGVRPSLARSRSPLHLKKIARAHRMRHAANKEKVAQINAHSPRDSSSTKIGPSPPLGGGLGSRPEASGQDPRCRPLQKRKGQFRCKVVLHSGRVSNSLPSPQFAEVGILVLLADGFGAWLPCVHAARAKPQFGFIGQSGLSVLELIDRRRPEGKERGGACAAPLTSRSGVQLKGR